MMQSTKLWIGAPTKFKERREKRRYEQPALTPVPPSIASDRPRGDTGGRSVPRRVSAFEARTDLLGLIDLCRSGDRVIDTLPNGREAASIVSEDSVAKR